MILIWGTIGKEYKPRLFKLGEDRPEKLPDTLIVKPRDELLIVHRLSSEFEISESGVDSLMRFTGVADIPQIIGGHYEWNDIWGEMDASVFDPDKV